MKRGKKRKSSHGSDLSAGINLAELRHFLTQDALQFFTTIYLHDVAYHIYDHRELESLLTRLPSESPPVQKAVLNLAARYQPSVAQRHHVQSRLASVVEFTTRALCDISTKSRTNCTPTEESRTNA